MVNSKKMSKSSIVVIALAILLALSMILGLTGAWFTAKEVASEEDLTINKFGYVGVTMALDSANSGVYTNNTLTFADDTWSVATRGTKATTEALMPGDVIVGGSYTVKCEVAGQTAEDCYYLIKNGSKYYISDGATGLTEITAAENLEVLSNNDTFTFVGGEDVLVDPLTGNASQGKDYAGTNVASSYEIAAVQVRNITKAQAWDVLVGLFA